MSRENLTAMVVLAAGAWLGGCATLVSGSTQSVKITADHPPSESRRFTVEDEHGDVVTRGETPRTVNLATWRNYNVFVGSGIEPINLVPHW